MMPAAHDAIAYDAAPDDYQIVHVPRADGRRGSGLAVITAARLTRRHSTFPRS